MTHTAVRASTRRLAGLLTLAALATGCSGGDDPDPATEAAPEPATASTSPSTTPAAAAPARLHVPGNGTGTHCLARNRPGDRFSLYDPVLVALGDVTVTDVQPVATGDGVSLLDRPQVVTVISAPKAGPGVGVGADWPLRPDAVLRAATAWPDRSPLEGREIADGERVLPLLGFRVNRTGTVLEGVEIHYEDADGNVGTVLAPIETRIARGAC